MTEGEQLKQFIDNQPKSKISIARDLKITKQTLFQYFKSKALEPETRRRFEKYFGKVIFTEVSTDPQDMQFREDGLKYNSKPVSESDMIAVLNARIEDLKGQIEWIKKMYEQQVDKTDANLNEALSNQRVQMRQLAVLSHLQAEYYSAGDKKKFSEQLKKIDTLMTAGM